MGLMGNPVTGEPYGSVRAGRSDADALRRRMEAIRATGPFDHALAAGLLAVDVGSAYRAALLARDCAAAVLHTVHGWSFHTLARVIHGDGGYAHRVRLAVASVAPETSPLHEADEATVRAVLTRRQARVEELRGLLSQSRRLAATHISGRPDPTGGWPDFGLPDDDLARVRAAAEQLRLTDTYRVQLAAHRNVTAASLVEHADWAVPDVAALARTAPEHIDAARDAVGSQVLSYADPSTVVELADILDALSAREYALGRIQDDAMYQLLRQGMPAQQIAAFAQVEPSHVERLRPRRPRVESGPATRVPPRRMPHRRVA